MSLDRTIRWASASKMPLRPRLAQVLRDFIRGAGTVQWSRDRWFVYLRGTNHRALARQRSIFGQLAKIDRRERRGRWIEVWPSVRCLCVSVMTRQHDEYTNAVAEGLAALIARWWTGELEP